MPLQSNYTSYETPRFRKLSDDQNRAAAPRQPGDPGPHRRLPVRAGRRWPCCKRKASRSKTATACASRRAWWSGR